MTDFFSKERRIEENRQRLRELFEQFKKTENYYPLFLAYLTAFAIYFFDFIALLFQPFFTCYFMSLTLLTGLSFAYVLYLIWKFFDSVDWNFDYLPFGVYTEYPKEIKEDIPELREESKEFKEELLDRYIKDLEDFVQQDSDIYIEKKKKLSAIWRPMIISLLFYAINIAAYKTITTDFEKKEPQNNKVMSPTKIIAKESQVERKSHISDSVDLEISKKEKVKVVLTFIKDEDSGKMKKTATKTPEPKK